MTTTNVQNWGRFLVEAVQAYAQKNDIQFELFSGDWIMRLETKKDAKLGGPTTKYLFGNDFGLNNTATNALCNDKSATYQVLTREGVPALEHYILLRPESLGAPQGGTFALAQELFKSFGNSVVCKPNKGGGGSDILFAKSLPQLEATLLTLFGKYRAVTISPFVEIHAEYRVCVLGESVELIYEKKREDTQELQHNLSHGATAVEVLGSELQHKLATLAKSAAMALSGTFVHVDIIDVNGKLMVLEVNSGIMFEHYAEQSVENRQQATEVYHKALDVLFL